MPNQLISAAHLEIGEGVSGLHAECGQFGSAVVYTG